jgi:gluconolactonase
LVEGLDRAFSGADESGGTNYKDKLLFLGEGQGESIAPAIYLMNPLPPYNTKGKTLPTEVAIVYMS